MPAKAAAPRFFLLHRRRVWNEGEGKWIGWERKRGKLHELNRLLRGATDTTFLPIDGQAPRLPAGVRYVITLDADTRMPIGAAKRLVGKMAHPLNRPRFDPQRGLRRAGPWHPAAARDAVAAHRQRRLAVSARLFRPQRTRSVCVRRIATSIRTCSRKAPIAARESTTSMSSRRRLQGQIPENTVLSHDLLEGIFARAGLASDIEVVEEFPVALRRGGRAPASLGARRLAVAALDIRTRRQDRATDRRKTPLPLMGRWKMLDNLRRSLSAPSALLALLIALAAAAAGRRDLDGLHPADHRAAALAAGASPASFRAAPAVSLRNHLRALGGDFALGLLQSAFLITFLAHQAWLMVDAIVAHAVSRRSSVAGGCSNG